MKKFRNLLCILLTLSMLAFLPMTVNAAANTTPMLAAGGWQSIALKDDGSVWVWGDTLRGSYKTPEPTEGVDLVNNATAIAAGSRHAVALRDDGTVWAWGGNNVGQLGIGSTTLFTRPMRVQNLINVTAIAAGDFHSAAIADGVLWTWGENWRGQLGDGAGGITGGEYSASPVEVTGLDEVVAVAAGNRHTLALQADGTVWAWGENVFGQLGNGLSGTANRSNIPVQVEGLEGVTVTALAAGENHSAALADDGSVWTWGHNGRGQLGDSAGGVWANHSASPVKVPGLSGVTAIAAGNDHTAALKNDGTIWIWGWNQYGQLGDGTDITRLAPVQMHNISDAAAIAAGGWHTIALRSDGTVWTAGLNSYGQLGDGTTNTTLEKRPTPVQVLGQDGEGYLNLLSDPPAVVPATGVSISGAAERGMIVGDTLQLTATVAPQNATNKSVVWTSSNNAVAAVDAAGLVRATGEGQATITVTTASGNHTATIILTVNRIPVTGITIHGDATRLTIPGAMGTFELTAAVAPANATNQNFTWESSDESIVKCWGGTVYPQKLGTAKVTATSEDGNFKATVTVIVRVFVNDVVIPGDFFRTMTVGDTVQLKAIVSPEEAAVKTVTWSTTNAKVATVDQTGFVRCIAPGDVVIIATPVDGRGIATSVSIKVTAPATKPYFSEGKSMTLHYKDTKKLDFKTSATGLTNWASGNRDVVIVDREGNVTGTSRGTAKVIAIDSKGASAEIDVTVKYVWWQWLIVIFLFGWAWY